MSIKIRPYQWSEKHQDFVEVPLDDADAHTIEVARLIAKGDVSSLEEIEKAFAQVDNPSKFPLT